MRRFALALAILALTLVGWPEPVAAADPGEYRSAVGAALGDLERGDSQGIARAAARLRAFGPVTLPDGTTVYPSNAAILAALDAQPPDVAAARARLLALQAQLARPQAPVATASDDARSSLRRVLDRPEFRPKPPPDPVMAFLQDLLDRLAELLGGIRLPEGIHLPSIGEARQGESRSPGVLAGLLVTVLLVVWVVRRVRREMGPGVATAPAEPTEQPLTSELARAEAERLAGGGAYRPAVRALCLAALLRCDERGRLRFDRSLTNREVLSRLTAQSEASLADLLAPLLERFDRFWYGRAQCSPDDYADFSRLAGRVWEAV